ncbi:hypothetical protein Hanom_Chr02g00145881 [Helianthus anomalus]
MFMPKPTLPLSVTRLLENGTQCIWSAPPGRNIASGWLLKPNSTSRRRSRRWSTFHKEKKSEEWGLQGLKKKLQASEDLLAEEHRNWCAAYDNDNKKMYVARTKITNLEAQVEELKKSEASYKEKYEEAKSHRERVEVDLSPQILRKDRDLAGKDTEIAELKRHLREAGAQGQHAALIVTQENYAEVQSTVEPLVSDLGWMQHQGIANSILNATKLDKAVVVLTMVARAAGRSGYVKCATHEALVWAEENYNNLSLSVKELVTEALKHDDYVSRLKSIFEPQETAELMDEEDEAGDDGAE